MGTLLVSIGSLICYQGYLWLLVNLNFSVVSSRLNEGHTVYLERMIGRCLEGEQFRQFKAMGGWKELQDSVRT